MALRRAVITGMGIVSPLGCEVETVWKRLVKGQSGIRPIKQFDATRYPSKVAGEVFEFEAEKYLNSKERRRMDPFSIFGIVAARLAMEDAGITADQGDPWRMGVLVGSGIGGLHILQAQAKMLGVTPPDKLPRYSPFMIPQMITNIIAGQIAIEHGFKGPNFCVTSACASATHSIGESLRLIQHNEADVIIAGGTEGTINELGVGGFCAMRALSTKRNDEPEKASRPFDADRDGFVIGEGAGIIVLEELEHAKKRGANIIAEVSGYGRTCDAYHITAPDSKGEGATRGMKAAADDAGLNAEDIDYINAHGTSTNLNDKGETLATKQAFGEDAARKIPISSTKSMTGHLLGAAGGVETIFCAKVMQTGIIPPTINLDNPDPDCDLDYVPHTAREQKVDACLSNSLGFGGHNATLAFKAYK